MKNIKAVLLINILLFAVFCWLSYPLKEAKAGYASVDKIVEKFRADGVLEQAIQKNCVENTPFGVTAADRDEFCRLAGYTQVTIQPSQKPLPLSQSSPSPKPVEEETEAEEVKPTVPNQQKETAESDNVRLNIFQQIFAAITNFFTKLFKR